jgi:hypothetical protein
VISTVVVGSIDSSADSASWPAAASDWRTASRSPGSVETTMLPASGMPTSAAPASIAANVTSSGSRPLSGMLMIPFCSNCQATFDNEPPALLNVLRISEAVRFRLSVMAVTMTATLAGPIPS